MDKPEPVCCCELVTDCAEWSPRYGHTCAEFRDRLWLVAGSETHERGRQHNDVWSSEDGRYWRREVDVADWAPRWGHALFVLKDRLWLIGGLADVDPIVNLADVWSSSDGVHWRCELAETPWQPRHVWAPVMHGGRMYLIAGATDGQHYYNDVWSSADGLRWEKASPAGAMFEKRKCLAGVSLAGRIWIAGGSVLDASEAHGARYVSDVWSSPDGRDWTQATAAAAWQPRAFHQMLAIDSVMWLIGGNVGGDDAYLTDIWRSADGARWTRAEADVPWPARHAEAMVQFRGRTWVLGGTSSSRGTWSRNDIWAVDVPQYVRENGRQT